MNSCEHYQELISRLVDGEVSHDEHEALMEHMKTCSRCNAMYAVFHDLSDILSEQPEELPEGLHENIMADVRRSDLRRKNRRMRTIGLRTALTAAACLVLVLFAASGFLPGRALERGGGGHPGPRRSPGRRSAFRARRDRGSGAERCSGAPAGGFRVSTE